MKFGHANRRGLTLLEMSLALAIAITLAALAVPAAGGWLQERAFRLEIERIAAEVMRARREAESAGETRIVWFAGEREPEPLAGEASVIVRPSPGFSLLRQNRRGQWEDAGGSNLRIQAGGIVSPTPLKLEKDGSYILFRFDPLTGHLDELEFSFHQ